MSRKEGIPLVIAIALVVVLAGVMSATSAAQSPTGPNGEKLVPLDIKLPKPLFQGTPQQIKPTPNMEKYNEKPRPPFYAPAGVTNLALHKTVTSSDKSPVIGELTMVTDGEKEGADDGYVELGRASSGCRSTWARRQTSTPWSSGTIMPKDASITAWWSKSPTIPNFARA